MKTTIYYFSGTGNSLKVAKDISDGLKDTEIIQICSNNIGFNNTTSKKIGFIFPVYVCGMPLLVKEFIEKVEIPRDAYVYTVVTFGASAGASISQLERLLINKGIKLSAAFKMKMPGNYQVMYSPISEKKQKQCFENEKENITKIVKSINSSEIVKCNGARDKLIKSVGAMMYGSFAPYKKDENFWTDGKCNGCGICVKVCPANNII